MRVAISMEISTLGVSIVEHVTNFQLKNQQTNYVATYDYRLQ